MGGGDLLTAEEAQEIAIDAYIYAYPLVLMQLTFRAPAAMNQFVHFRKFPDPSFMHVVRPNADTLYSILNFHVSREPLVIRVPDSDGRYYLLQMLDMWTDVFASVGKRTTGTGAQQFAIVGPDWRGQLPDDVELIRSPTGEGAIIGRTQTNGVLDYPNVHRFQDGISAVPLAQYGRPYQPPPAIETEWSVLPPVQRAEALTAEEFFSLFVESTRLNPPHANDQPMLARMRRIGIQPARPFVLASSPPALRQAIEQSPPAARSRMAAHRPGRVIDGWWIALTGIGTYGAAYLQRAAVANSGLGANTVEDAVYPAAVTDASGHRLASDRRYQVHFGRGQTPPVRAFWSLTMYNDQQLFAANPINRYAIGDRDRLTINDDGSLDLLLQRGPPADRSANWLPAPATGNFSLNLRLYWPKPAVFDGRWTPPPVRPIGPG